MNGVPQGQQSYSGRRASSKRLGLHLQHGNSLSAKQPLYLTTQSMKDKADSGLSPPAAAPGDALSIPMATDPYMKRKKPHSLPPLDKFRNLEGRGSPVPRARRRSSIEEQLLEQDGQVASADGRPLIRLTRCPDSGQDDLGFPARLPPAKRGSLSPPAEQGGPLSPVTSPLSSKYAPLQPIRRSAGNDNANEESRNGNAMQ